MKIFFLIILIATNLVAGDGDIDVLWNYEKFYKYLKDNLSLSNISSSCSSELREFFTNNDTLYDLYDASSKYPWSGLKTGTKSDLGNFDQCINIDHTYSGGKILGKYCLYGLNLVVGNNAAYSLSLCMPSGCTADDYKILFNPSASSFNDSLCVTKQYAIHYTEGDRAMITVFLVFAICIVISTIYDVYLCNSGRNAAHPVYVAFSAFTNLRKLLDTSKGNNDEIQIFHGLKSIFMSWVIYFHFRALWELFIVSNNESVANGAAHMFSALLSVDAFFFMSGFLNAYGYLKQKNTSVISQLLNIPSLIIHRCIRLTPAMAMLYFTYITLFKHICFGPLIKILSEEKLENCRQNWLPFFLYYQNYHNDDNLCLANTWYLSVDMQLFVISPIVLIPVAKLLGKNKKNFKFVMYLLLVLNIFAQIIPILDKLLTNKRDVYDHATTYRVSVYAIGIMMGTFIREKKSQPFLNNIKSKSAVNLAIWIVILHVMAITAVLYQHYSYDGYSENVISISHSLLRSIWCLGLCWMVYSSYHGYGGIINWILTRPTLQIMAKTSYCMYLVHWLVLEHYYFFTIRTRLWFHNHTVFIYFCGIYVLTFALAIIWCISFEFPMLAIEKLIFKGGMLGGTSSERERKGKIRKC